MLDGADLRNIDRILMSDVKTTAPLTSETVQALSSEEPF